MDQREQDKAKKQTEQQWDTYRENVARFNGIVNNLSEVLQPEIKQLQTELSTWRYISNIR